MLARLTRWLHREEAGFTLIELMIVILVILILAAILIPQFGLARERARKASCVSNQRNIETAVAMWATGNTMNSSTPSFANLTSGTPAYTTASNFIEPDHNATPDGTDYYLSQGSATGGTVNASAPSYGHVACAYDAVKDPWVANYDPIGAGTGLSHTRGASASP